MIVRFYYRWQSHSPNVTTTEGPMRSTLNTIFRLLITKKELFFTPFLLLSFLANATEPAAFRCWDGSFAYQYFSVKPAAEKITVNLESQIGFGIPNESLGLTSNDRVRELEINFPKEHCRAAESDARVVACVHYSTQESPSMLSVRYIEGNDFSELKEKILPLNSVSFEAVKEQNLGSIWLPEQTQLLSSRVGRLNLVLETGGRAEEHRITIQSYPEVNLDENGHSCLAL